MSRRAGRIVAAWRRGKELGGGQVTPDETSPERFRSSLISLVAERQTTELEFDDLLLASGLAAGDFFTQFDSLQGCLETTASETMATICRGMVTSSGSVPGWRSGLRAALEGVVTELEADEALTAFLRVLVDSTRCALTGRRELVATLADLIYAGNDDPEVVAPRTREFADIVAGGACAVLIGALRTDGVPGVAALIPEVMCLIVQLYAGDEVGREELARSAVPRLPRRDDGL